MNSAYTAQLNHMIQYVSFQTYFFHLNLFPNKKLRRRNLFAIMKINRNASLKNFTFRQFHAFVFGPIPKEENAKLVGKFL